MSRLADILKAIQLKPLHLFGITLFGIILLFIPKDIGTFFGLDYIMEQYRGIIGTITIASFIFWFIHLFPILSDWLKERKRKRSVLNYLKSLSEGEKKILARCVKNNHQSVNIPFLIENDYALSLSQKRLLIQAPGSGTVRSWPYTIPDFVWKHIKSRYNVYFDDVGNDDI